MKTFMVAAVMMVCAASVAAQTTIEVSGGFTQPVIERIHEANRNFLPTGLRMDADQWTAGARICFGRFCAAGSWYDAEIWRGQQFLQGPLVNGSVTGWNEGFRVTADYRLWKMVAIGGGWRFDELQYRIHEPAPRPFDRFLTDTQFDHKWNGPVLTARAEKEFWRLYGAAFGDWSPLLHERQEYIFQAPGLSAGSDREARTNANADGIELRAGFNVWKGITPFVSWHKSVIATGENPALVLNAGGPTQLRSSEWAIGIALRHKR